MAQPLYNNRAHRFLSALEGSSHVNTPTRKTPVSGNPVKDIRQWTHLSCRQLADMFEVTPSTMSRWLNGHNTRPGCTVKINTIHALLIPLVDMFDSRGLKSWLLAPSNKSGSSPFTLLKASNYLAVSNLIEQFYSGSIST